MLLVFEIVNYFVLKADTEFFIMEDVTCSRVDRLSEGKHLKFHLGDEQVSALAFNKGQKYEEVVHKESMTLVGTLSINVFRGNKSINFIVEEIL